MAPVQAAATGDTVDLSTTCRWAGVLKGAAIEAEAASTAVNKIKYHGAVPMCGVMGGAELFVPFSMQQVYQKRTAAKGNGGWLVQRAIRGASHCDFTVAEQAEAFDDMVKWERDGIKPGGDDVVTPATVAASSYGCTYTRNTLGPDESGTTRALRPAILGSTPACPGYISRAG